MQITRWRGKHDMLPAKKGIVAAKHPLIAEAGGLIMEQGGNAIDAAVAAAFANTVVEPFMSGIGGQGHMLIYNSRKDRVQVVDYPCLAPIVAHQSMFELQEGVGSGLYPWRKVKNEANVVGHLSIAVPGTVAGLCLAQREFGHLSLSEVMAPAIRYAAEGFSPNWYASLLMSRDFGIIQSDSNTSKIWLDGGCPRYSIDASNPAKIVQKRLASTLAIIAEKGSDAFYRGVLTPLIIEDLKSGGSIIETEDLNTYHAKLINPLEIDYRRHRICTVPGASGGPTLAQILHLASRFDLPSIGFNTWECLHIFAECVRLAFADRYRWIADDEHIPVPWKGLFSNSYRDERVEMINLQQALINVNPGNPWHHQEDNHNEMHTAVDTQRTGDCTTHLSTMDAEGNMVSCTQTSVGVFGSGVTLPQTGILMNNAMCIFDPEPGRVNSIASGKQSLINMAPALVFHQGEPILTIGSSGGRRIIGCNAQIISNILDHGLGIQEAIEAPRLDYSTPQLLVDSRLPKTIIERFLKLGHQLQLLESSIGQFDFASPVGVLRDPKTGLMFGGIDPFYPGAAAVL